MQIRVLYFAVFRERLGTDQGTVTVAAGARVRDAIAALADQHAPIAALRGRFRVAVNAEMVDDDHPLADGDELALIPPVAGGADPRHVALLATPLSLDRCVAAVAGPGMGGVVTFTGMVRRHSHGAQIDHLDYEAYGDMAVRELTRLCDELEAELPGVRVAVEHRTGRLEVGELAVVIAAAAPHRAEAFTACRAMIDRLKERVPIWKKETGDDGSTCSQGKSAMTCRRLEPRTRLIRSNLWRGSNCRRLPIVGRRMETLTRVGALALARAAGDWNPHSSAPQREARRPGVVPGPGSSLSLICLVSWVAPAGVLLTRWALQHQDLDVARWAAARALLVAPEDELLLVERINTEVLAGNTDEVRRLVRWVTGQARALGVDLAPETVDACQRAMEGRTRPRAARCCLLVTGSVVELVHLVEGEHALALPHQLGPGRRMCCWRAGKDMPRTCCWRIRR